MNFNEIYEYLKKGAKATRTACNSLFYWKLDSNDVLRRYSLYNNECLGAESTKDLIRCISSIDWEVIEETEQWKPKENDIYWHITGSGKITRKYNKFSSADKDKIEFKNYFETKEQAEHAVEKLKVIKELENLAAEYSKDIDWKNINQQKWTIAYNYFEKRVMIDSFYNYKCLPFDVYFPSFDSAYKAMQTIGPKRLTKYYFDEELSHFSIDQFVKTEN